MWEVNSLVATTTYVKGAIHEHTIKKLNKLPIPKSSIKTFMKNKHQNAKKYLVLNKRKSDKQAHVHPPPNTYRDRVLAIR